MGPGFVGAVGHDRPPRPARRRFHADVTMIEGIWRAVLRVRKAVVASTHHVAQLMGEAVLSVLGCAPAPDHGEGVVLEACFGVCHDEGLAAWSDVLNDQ